MNRSVILWVISGVFLSVAGTLRAQGRPAEPVMETVQPADAPAGATAAPGWHPVIAFKTDLMLWAGVMPGFRTGTWTPNLAAEVYFAKRWSVQLAGAYADWDSMYGEQCLSAVTGLDLEGRYWVAKEGFGGLYTGIYGTYGDFDVQEKTTGRTGTYYMVGATAGWAQALSRHWMIEAAVRLGYRGAQSKHYTIESDRCYFDNKKNEGKFAPQIRVQLVYRIGGTRK